MALHFFIGTFAAFGAVCFVNLLWLWLSRRRPGLAMVCICRNPRQELCAMGRYRALWAMGLFKGPLWVVGSHLSPAAQGQLKEEYPMHFFTKEEFSRYDPTGTGDLTGHRRRGGVSEL